MISIHALLAESDEPENQIIAFDNDFYPRSPCGERLVDTLKIAGPVLFLSTLSLRRATVFNLFANPGSTISIHALLAESDADKNADWVRVYVFLSTLSLRRATVAPVLAVGRAGYFYPRSPCGERPIHPLLCNVKSNFYPRSPCGERRYLVNTYHRIFGISIHALLAESDGGSGVGSWPRGIFLSTLSLRRATDTSSLMQCQVKFLSTLSLRRATVSC